MAEFKQGAWVRVWARVVHQDHLHPEDVRLEFESHNEQYEAHVRKDRVEAADEIPEFAIRCTHLYGSTLTDGQYWRCYLYERHPDNHVANAGSLSWSDEQTAGYIEEST